MKNKTLILLLSVLALTSNAQTLKDEWVVCNTQGCKLLDPYYSDGVTMKWEGACENGKANGYGKLTKYKDGEYESTYEGEFKNGIREGKGKFSHKDGTVREGLFVNGQMTGSGTMTSESGQKYIGDFINYRMHGIGTVFFANGAKFEGFTVADRMYTGKHTNFDGKVTYIQKYYPVNKIDVKVSDYKPEIGVRVTEYFDADWKRCKQKDAAYYRLITYEADNKPKGVIKDYYISGQLQSEFEAVYLDYDDEGKNFHEGEATWYFKNGKIEQKRFYYNNKINGKNTFYYDNGQIAQEADYEHGKLNGSYQQWYKTGKPKLIALYENSSLVENKYIEYDENGLGALVFNENFFKNKENWEVKIDGSASKLNEKGQVSISVYNDKTTSRYNYVTLDQNSNYSIESIIQKNIGKGNEGYGLIFGFKDWNNYYNFLISEYGSYLITGQFEGVNIKIADWTKSTAINIGNKRNLLKVLKFGDEFIFSINGQVVERTKSKDLRGNNIGIIAHGKGDYVLENIVVKEFVTADELAKKVPKSVSSSSNWKGNGTGFFIDPRGYIATNYHVVEDAADIEIDFIQNGQKKSHKAKVISTDKQNDLAVIKIDDPSFKSYSKLPYNFKTQISDVGSNVFALGYPLTQIMGNEVKFTDGKISSKTGFKGDITTYQISVPIQPGNSGGPLFDYDGNIVGITNAGINKSIADNVAYAIKSSYLKNLIDVLPENLNVPSDQTIATKSLTEKIKLLSDYVVLIKIR